MKSNDGPLRVRRAILSLEAAADAQRPAAGRARDIQARRLSSPSAHRTHESSCPAPVTDRFP